VKLLAVISVRLTPQSIKVFSFLLIGCLYKKFINNFDLLDLDAGGYDDEYVEKCFIKIN
tara:strand:+ start:233 stop:409 length:177 start_codon:yes stop_codon:yes gene_type:complete